MKVINKSVDKKNIVFYGLVFLYFLYKTIFILYSAFRSGVGLDDKYETERLLNSVYFNDVKTEDYTNIYGLFPGLTGYLSNLFFNSEFTTLEALDISYYQFTHLAIACIALFGTFSLVILGKVLTNNYKFGVLAAGVLLAIPKWENHSFFNIKDIPVAVGITLATTGISVFLVKNIFQKQTSNTLLASILIIFGIILTIGTRPALVILILLQLLYLLIYIFMSKNLAMKKSDYIYLLSTYSLAFILTIVFIPQILSKDLNVLASIFTNSASFDFHGTGTLMFGYLHEHEISFKYVMSWYFARLPIILLIFLLLGLTLIFKQLIKDIFTNRDISIQTFLYGLLIIQGFSVPIFSIILKSTIYHATRMFLFTYPAMAVIITIGIWQALIYRKKNYQKKILVGLIIFALLFPSAESLRLHPYGYIYVNPLISLMSNISSEWETEYWMFSKKEASQWIPMQSRVEHETFEVANFYTNQRVTKSGKKYKLENGEFFFVSAHETVNDQFDSKLVKATTGNPISNLPPKCTFENVVTRKLRFEVIPLAYVARCQPSGLYFDGQVSVSWISESEVDENNRLFFWMTDEGESFRISNFQRQAIYGDFVFDIAPNPCNQQREIRVENNQGWSAVYLVPTGNRVERVSIPLKIDWLDTSIITINSDDINSCNAENQDDRNFVAKILNFGWIQSN